VIFGFSEIQIAHYVEIMLREKFFFCWNWTQKC